MSKNLVRSLIISATTAVLLVGFQNCSNKIAQQDMTPENSSQSLGQNDGSNGTTSTDEATPPLSSDQLPDNSSTLIIQPTSGGQEANNTPLPSPLPSPTPILPIGQSEEIIVVQQPAPAPAPAPMPTPQTPAGETEEIIVVQQPAPAPAPAPGPTPNPSGTPVVVVVDPSAPGPMPSPTPIPAPAGTPVVTGTPASDEPELTEEDKDCINWALADEPEAAVSCLKQPKTILVASKDKDEKDEKNKKDKDEKDKNAKSEKDDKEHKDEHEAKVPAERCYVNSEDDKDDIDYEGLCRLNKKQTRFLTSLANVLNLFKLRGLTVITPESVGSSTLYSVEDVRGTIVICGLNINRVNNTRGKLVAVDSSIKTFSDHRGKAVFINTAADLCSNIKGKIKLLGAASACKAIENSKGLVEVNRSSQRGG